MKNITPRRPSQVRRRAASVVSRKSVESDVPKGLGFRLCSAFSTNGTKKAIRVYRPHFDCSAWIGTFSADEGEPGKANHRLRAPMVGTAPVPLGVRPEPRGPGNDYRGPICADCQHYSGSSS